MKIIFICGSLEPGKDGVGDYIRRLTSELIKQGNDVGIIALNDKHIDFSSQGYQSDYGVHIQILRLSTQENWDDRMRKAKGFINVFRPHWLSLQFVPFAFQNKGLPFGIGRSLKRIGNDAKWHIMFHELWVGMDKEAFLQYKLWGLLQRMLIKSLVKRLQPLIVNTQTKLYKHMLNTEGINSEYLPLFGNIPPNKKTREALCKKNNKNKISLLIFGSIHPGAPVKDFAKEVAEYAAKTKCTISLTFIGKNGIEMQNWFEEWKKNGLAALILGESDRETISSALYEADYGIATTPISLLEKSGSVAAMLEHELPVLSVCRPWKPRVSFLSSSPKNVYQYEKGNLTEIFKSDKSVTDYVSLRSVTQHFLNDLQNGSIVLPVEKPREA